MQLVEVKYYQPETLESENRKLDGYLSHPARYVFCICFLDGDGLRLIGGAGVFPVIEGQCDNFLGKYRASVIREVDDTFLMRADRYELA